MCQRSSLQSLDAGLARRKGRDLGLETLAKESTKISVDWRVLAESEPSLRGRPLSLKKAVLDIYLDGPHWSPNPLLSPTCARVQHGLLGLLFRLMILSLPLPPP